MNRCSSISRVGLSLGAAAIVALFASCLNRTIDLGQLPDGSMSPTSTACGEWVAGEIHVAKPCGSGVGTYCDPYYQMPVAASSPACEAGRACYPEQSRVGDCYPVGSGKEGGPCHSANDCEPKMTCARLQSTAFQCVPVCESGTTSDGGASASKCTGINSMIGVIAPSTGLDAGVVACSPACPTGEDCTSEGCLKGCYSDSDCQPEPETYCSASTECLHPPDSSADGGLPTTCYGHCRPAGLNPGSDPDNVQCDRRFYSEGLRITTPLCPGYGVAKVELEGDACGKRLDVGVANLVWVFGKALGACRATVTYSNGTTFSADTVFSLVRDGLCGDYYKGAGHVADPASCSDAGTGNCAEDPSALGNFTTKFWDTFLQRMQECFGGPQIGWAYYFDKRFFAGTSFSPQASISAGRVRFACEFGTPCIDELRAWPCDELSRLFQGDVPRPVVLGLEAPNPGGLSDLFSGESACAKLYTGLVPEGSACYETIECVPGRYCANATACPGVCEAYPSLGASCELRACAPGSACVEGKCRAFAPEAAQCEGGSAPECAFGLYCDTAATGVAGTCRKKLETGPCNGDEACSGKTRCIGLADPGTAACAPAKPEGAVCTVGRGECERFTYCANGSCTVFPRFEGSCGTSGGETIGCLAAWCNAGACQRQGESGATCDPANSRQCYWKCSTSSLTCVDQCTAPF